jgi:signal transduction histidine kinase
MAEAKPAEGPSPTPAPVSVQRLAETFAGAAFRSVITFDYAALSELVKRAAGWPEVVYLSVEDAQGRIIAHTDPTKVGQGSGAGTTREAGASRGPYQEVIAVMSGADTAGKPAPRMGQVRLGYLAPDVAGVAPVSQPEPVTRRPVSRFPLPVALAVAALAAVPLGFGLVKLGGAASGSGDVPVAELRKIRSLRQARWTIAHWMKEADSARAQLATQRSGLERLEDELAERAGQLAEVDAQREHLIGEAAHWLGERDHLRAELEEREHELELTRAVLHECATEVEGPRLERALLEAEVADLRDEVVAARDALARHPVVCRDLLDQELRQYQHRAIAYISHAIRRSLTNVLGFSKLLLRQSDGPLTEAQHANVLNIHEAGTQLLRIVSDLSDLTQAESGNMELRDEIADLEVVIREIADPATSGGPRAICVSCPPVLPRVRANERRLVQMMLTLTQPLAPDVEGAVELSVQTDEESVTLIVAHCGVQIPTQDLPSLFDPFSPIDATATLQDDGGRLRLALAKALASTLGGQLSVDAVEGTGTVFTVTLPAAADVPAVA